MINHYGEEEGELTREARAQFIDLREKAPGTKKTWEEALQAHLPENAKPVLAPTAKKNFLLLPITDALAAAKKAGLKLDAPKPAPDHAAERQKEEEAREAKRAQSNTLVKAANPVILQALAKAKIDDLLHFLAKDFCARRLEENYMDRHGLTSEKALQVHLIKLSGQALAAACVEACFMGNSPVDWKGELDEDFTNLCSAFGVDLKKLEASLKK